MWDLIVSVPDHCLSFYFTEIDDCYATNLKLEQGDVWDKIFGTS